jgi:flagellar basal-body rod protein FlgC
MNLFGMMDISSSALRAERVRAEVVASNMANAETTRTEDGGPYKRHHVVFAADAAQSFGSVLGGQMATPGGVSVAGVVQDESAPLKRFDPGHPDAGTDGYVSYPDINPLTEMVDLMGAQRAYGMNASAVQAEKGMVSASLDILK